MNLRFFLQSALDNETLDFSRIFAVLRPLSHIIDEADQLFNEVAASTSTLAKTFTLSSGQGLVEIWSHLFDRNQIEAYAQVQSIFDSMCSSPVDAETKSMSLYFCTVPLRNISIQFLERTTTILYRCIHYPRDLHRVRHKS